MSRFKIMVAITVALGLVGCDQVRDKLVNGFAVIHSKSVPSHNIHDASTAEGIEPTRQIQKIEQPPESLGQQAHKTPERAPPLRSIENQTVKTSRPTNPSNASAHPNKPISQQTPNEPSGFKDTDW